MGRTIYSFCKMIYRITLRMSIFTQDSIHGSNIVHHHITIQECVASCIENSLRNGLEIMDYEHGHHVPPIPLDFFLGFIKKHCFYTSDNEK